MMVGDLILIVSLNIEQTRDLFLHVAKQMIVHKPLLAELDRHSGGGAYGVEMAIGFTAVAEKLSVRKPLHINDIFKTSGVAILTSMGGFSGVIFGTLFLGGVKGMPVMEELNVKQLAMILTNSLQILKSRGGTNRGDQIIIDAFERAVVAFGHSVKEGDTLVQALHVAEFGAQESMEKLVHYQAKSDSAKLSHQEAFAFHDPGAKSVWLLFKSMREWVASLENSTW
jgi:dihydroxyacetone kinase